MKKTFAICLAFILIISGVCVMAYTDTTNSKYKNSIDFLTTYGIVSGEDGKFNPNDNITRAEAVKMLLYASNIKEDDLSLTAEEDEPIAFEGLPFEQPDAMYSDITQKHWGYKYITYGSVIGLINGFDDGTIRPDDNVTYSQFLTMALHTVGYESYADEAGGYPYGYYIVAKTLNITGNMDNVDLDFPITREMAAQMTYHLMYVPLLGIESYTIENDISIPIMQVFDGTDGTERKTLLSDMQNNNE